MGNSDEKKSSEPEKSPRPAVDQQNIHVFADWAKMQAYYGPRLAAPPFLNSAVTNGLAPPPYMWGPPQAMMPPYGTPYAAFYAHGGIYSHPGVPLVGTSSGMEYQAKSSENTGGSLVKKLKEFNGLAMSIGNDNVNSNGAEGGTEPRFSKSGETEDSSDGSNGITGGVGQKGKKRSREETPNDDVGRGSENGMDRIVAFTSVPEKSTGSVSTALELNDLSNTNVNPAPITSAKQPKIIESRLLKQNEPDLKRERRKQSNRESARRSRLRKQAETEELAKKVQALATENIALKSEISKLIENSGNLKAENAMLTKLKDAQHGQTEIISLHSTEESRLKPVGTANLLARVNNSDRRNEGESYENKSSGTKLRQLLDTSPRTDAVAAN